MWKLKRTRLFLAMCILISVASLWLIAARPPVAPVSLRLVGMRTEQGVQRAVVFLTNSSLKPLSCSGTVNYRRGPCEIVNSFRLVLAATNSAEVCVGSPPARWPGLVFCKLDGPMAHHSRWVCVAGGALGKAGLHLYHTYPSFDAPVRLKLGKGKPPASIADGLHSFSISNAWAVP